MARLRDLPRAIRGMGFFPFCKKVWHEISDDNLWTWASALAYSWLFAIFPFFLVLLTLIPTLPVKWRQEAKAQINNAINQLPHDAKVTVSQYIEPKLDKLIFDRPPAVTVIWIVGLAVTLWAASGGMAMTMSAMDRCYDVERARPFYKQRPLAVGLTLIVASLIIVVVVLIPVGTMVTNYLTQGTERLLVQATKIGKPADPRETPKQIREQTQTTMPATTQAAVAVAAEMVEKPGRFAVWIVLWQVARYGLALLLIFWVVALIYHFGPNVRQRFRIVTPGAVFTVAMWILLGVAFRAYVDRWGKYGETYGAVGGVIILLFLFYLDALILLIGAEINSEVDCVLRDEACEREKPPEPAETVDTRPATETP
jgi:membrane protein